MLLHISANKPLSKVVFIPDLTYIQNGAIAVRAPGTKQVVVVRLAVGLPIPFEEVPRAQLLGAMGAGEVLRVPGLAQCGYNLPYDRFIAGVAAPLLTGVDPLSAHISLEIAEHRIQILLGGTLALGGLGWTRVLRIGDGMVLGLALVHLRTEVLKTGFLGELGPTVDEDASWKLNERSRFHDQVEFSFPPPPYYPKTGLFLWNCSDYVTRVSFVCYYYFYITKKARKYAYTIYS